MKPPCRRRGLALAAGAALVLASAACRPGTGSEAPEFRATVRSQVVETGSVERVLVTTGTLRPRAEAKLLVQTAGDLLLARSPATGRRLAVGDSVAKGQTVAVVAADEVHATARLASRRQALEAAEAERDRTARLHAEGVVPDLRLDEARTRVSGARADLDQALVQARTGRLVAPIDGVLSRVTAAPDGERVQPGHEVAVVIRHDEVVVDLDLAAAEALAVAAGMPVRVRPHATAEVHEGVLDRIAPAVDPEKRTVRAEVVVPNVGLRLLPGLLVRAEIVLESRAGVVVVPTDAVDVHEGGHAVFVVAPGPVARRRAVEIGLVNGDVTEVRQGLEAGERVVVSGHRTLSDGTRVVEVGGPA